MEQIASIATGFEHWRRPVLVAIMGLPGTGKTHVAHDLARRYPLVLMSTDSIRLSRGLRSGPETLKQMCLEATSIWRDGGSVIFDGIHLGRANRDALRALAREQGIEWLLIYTIAAPTVVKDRLHQRELQPETTVAEGKFVITPEHFLRIASYLEEPEPDEEVWRVDTSGGDIAAQLAGVERRLAMWLGTGHTSGTGEEPRDT